MRNIIILCLLLASLALAQRQSVVVLPSLADSESKIAPKQLDVLTEDVRTIVTKTLPSKDFNLLKQDLVKEVLGDEAFVNACEEGTCVGDLVKKVQANFGARCDVYTVDKQLYLKFELYGTLKGQREAGTIAQFNEPVKNFAEMQAIIKKEAPAMFGNIAKVASAAPLVPGGISGLRSADGDYEFNDQKFYLANVTTEPEGAILSFNGCQIPVVPKRLAKLALPIMATPTLEGEEAARFYEELKENERRGISDEEIRRGTEIFNAVMKKNPEMRGLFGGVAILKFYEDNGFTFYTEKYVNKQTRTMKYDLKPYSDKLKDSYANR